MPDSSAHRVRLGPRLTEAVCRTIGRHGLLEPGDRVVAAVSGGTDSTALAHILVALATHLGLAEVVIAHLNHGLRGPASDADAAFVRDLARSVGCRHVEATTDLSGAAGNLEQAARRARYGFLEDTARQVGARVVATGHTADDNAETVLMNLVRGAAGDGLAGIPPRRGPVVRPLVETSRQDLAAFLKANNLAHVEDATNRDFGLLRNRVRHELIPLLEDGYNPRMKQALCRLAGVMAQERDFWRIQVDRACGEAGLERSSGRAELSATAVRAWHPALARRVVRDVLAGFDPERKTPAAVHVQAVLDLIHEGQEHGQAHLPRGITARRARDRLVFTRG